MRSTEDRFYQLTYTDSDIFRICKHANIEVAQHYFVKSELEHYAAIWRSNNYRHAGPDMAPHKITSALNKIAQQADKLSELVEGLPSEAFHALSRADSAFLTTNLFEENKDRTSAGHKITRYTSEQGEETMLIDDLDDLLWSVDALAEVARNAVG